MREKNLPQIANNTNGVVYDYTLNGLILVATVMQVSGVNQIRISTRLKGNSAQIALTVLHHKI